MLLNLLRLVESSQGPLDVLAISRELNSQPSAVAGMIGMLIQMGRLDTPQFECGPCGDCGEQHGCPLSKRVP